MKRLVLFLMFTMISCSGCSRINETLEFVQPEVLEADSLTLGTEVEEKGILEIREKYFLLQISDIFFNFDLYKDRVVKVEGLYGVDYDSNEPEFHVVYRFGPGCCGDDGWGGFFLNYEGEWPTVDDWIEVIGTPRIEKGEYRDYLYLDVISITVKDEVGEVLVYQ
ncbi:hypothetical protein [Turicibacter sanguinis]|uniref:TIGR03943 family putative permease subunit n=1 Tax=Turicibacter sanguinis TaxID=154288 RepID=UPI0018AA2CF1|nr:hypothetical protein [Turicibacter sanguinis]MDB8551582.1 hypothetical protein [Turicibacter sanguinis]